MKGQATITVKDKNGNIKTSVKQHNKIFNMPQILLQDLADNGDIYLTDAFSTSQKTYRPISLKNYFRRLTAHSEDLSLTDPYDFKFPELIGGYTAATGHSEYANASVYNVTDDKITLTWAWTPAEQKTIKSIALHSQIDNSGADCSCKKIKNDMILMGNFLYKKSIGLSNSGYNFEQISGIFAPGKDDNILIRCDNSKFYLYDTTTETNTKEIESTSYNWSRLLAYHYPHGGYFIETARYSFSRWDYQGFTFDDDGSNFQSLSAKVYASSWLQINNRYFIKDYGYFDMETEKEMYSADYLASTGVFDKTKLMFVDESNANIIPIPIFNTTALNLSAPVTVEAGETITITYEITATE